MVAIILFYCVHSMLEIIFSSLKSISFKENVMLLHFFLPAFLARKHCSVDQKDLRINKKETQIEIVLLKCVLAG